MKNDNRSAEETKPKPEQEWTVELIEGWIRLNPTTWKSVLAFEHNAALADERGNVSMEASRELIMERDELREQYVQVSKDCNKNADKILQLRSQLAALVDALNRLRAKADRHELGNVEARAIIDAALAKEGK